MSGDGISSDSLQYDAMAGASGVVDPRAVTSIADAHVDMNEDGIVTKDEFKRAAIDVLKWTGSEADAVWESQAGNESPSLENDVFDSLFAQAFTETGEVAEG